jgi:hypothetical protein
MAQVTKIGVLGVSNAGAAPPLQTRRKYDRSDKIILRALADAPLLNIITQKTQKRPVSDTKFYMMEEEYRVQAGTLEGSTAGGTDAAITTSTAYFKVYGEGGEKAIDILRVNDKLHIPAFQTNQTATKGTGDGSTDGTVRVAGEDVIIAEIIDDNVVRITRGGGDTSATGIAGNCTASSGSLLKWEHKGNILPDGSSSPESFSQDLEEDYNYLENHREPWEVSAGHLITDFYGGTDDRRAAIQARAAMFRFMERSFWTGHRYMGYMGDGLQKPNTGGWMEFITDVSAAGTRLGAYDASRDLIMGDGTQRIWMVNKNFDLNNWGMFLNKALKWGNKGNKALVCGRAFAVELENMIRPYYGGFGWDESSFGFAVATARSTFGTLPIIIEQEFSDGAAGYDYWCAVVDMSFVWYCFGQGPCAVKDCGAQNTNLHVHQNIQSNDAAKRKDELFVTYGWDQHFRRAHSLLIWDGTK